MARTDPQLKFYASVELKEKIEASAQSSGRSMSAEINARLQQSFEPSLAAGDAQFLFAKWNRDLADAELENQTLKLHLAELGVVLGELAGSKVGSAADRLRWRQLSEEAISRSADAAQKADEAFSNFKAAHLKLTKLAAERGIPVQTQKPSKQ